MDLEVRKCPLFLKTFSGYSKNKQVKDKLIEFIKAKTSNPTAAFGSKDRTFTGSGNFSGFIHAGLTFDVSIVYKFGSVKGVKTLDLYGVFSHDDLGTGTPPSQAKQKSNAERLSNQKF